MPRSHSLARRTRLALQPLEGRDVPAGNLTAGLSPTGVLTITGDDDDNDVLILLTAGGAVLTSLSGTTVINDAADPALPVPLAGTVKSIKADFRGGADDVSIDPSADFVVAGPVKLNLGDGDNILDLTTTGRIGLGGLSVAAADGIDTVTVAGGANSSVGGTAKFTYGAGGSTTTLDGVGFTGVSVVAGDAIGTPNTVVVTNTTVARTLSANLGNSFPAVLDVTGSTLGGLTATGYAVSSILTDTTVTGNVLFKNGYSAALAARGLTARNVTMISPNPSLDVDDDPVLVNTPTTINGNLTLTASAWTEVAFDTDTLSEVKGNVTVKGGWFSDAFVTNEQFKVGKNLSLTLGGGDNLVVLGNGAGEVTVGGNLTIKGGTGNDLVALDRVRVTGAAKVQTFGGVDELSIETGSTFLKTFTADLGSGDDTILIAQATGSPAPVTFAGKATIKAGTGNDFLLLGLDTDPANGGDANSRVAFNGAGSVVDGGAGLNLFDDFTAQFSGVVPVNW